MLIALHAWSGGVRGGIARLVDNQAQQSDAFSSTQNITASTSDTFCVSTLTIVSLTIDLTVTKEGSDNAIDR